MGHSEEFVEPASTPIVGEYMSVRFDFQCLDGHEFTLWSDDARLCPVCGSEFLKRVFLTAPSVNSPKAKFVDNLLKRELDARGITNVQSSGREGDSASVTYRSTPEDLASEMVNKAFPQMDEKNLNNKNGIQQVMEKVTANWAQVGVKGVVKSGLGAKQNPLTKQILQNPTQFGRPRTVRIADPQNLQVSK